MLAVWPSNYPVDTILDFFTYAGAPGAYNLSVGSGAGFIWTKNSWSFSANYLSTNGNSSDPSVPAPTIGLAPQPAKKCGGIATDCAGSNGTVQIGYNADGWGLAAAYTYARGHNGASIYDGNATPLAAALSRSGTTQSYGISGYWSPADSGWIPSLSAGWGMTHTPGWDGDLTPVVFTPGPYNAYGITDYKSQSWFVGMQWSDVLLQGNSAGMAFGQPTYVTYVDFADEYPNSGHIDDANYAWEWWYSFQVSDNISVTPSIFYLSRPKGQATAYGDTTDRDNVPTDFDDTFSNFGGLVKATFAF